MKKNKRNKEKSLELKCSCGCACELSLSLDWDGPFDKQTPTICIAVRKDRRSKYQEVCIFDEKDVKKLEEFLSYTIKYNRKKLVDGLLEAQEKLVDGLLKASKENLYPMEDEDEE